ncbi:hypothetical protein [Chitinilyticum aquatile]|uniref:hypothetical protein n=1 Tax=Chitinilyticum aquatile TaxID=362520 RepID=UPI0003FC4E51|nr:hypothetical protein [Chitinilyticum aquatile]
MPIKSVYSGAMQCVRAILMFALCSLSGLAFAENYLGLSLGMSKKEVEARYGALKPSVASSYQNAYTLPKTTTLAGLPKEFEQKKAAEITIYFDREGKLWSIFITTDNYPTQELARDFHQLYAAYQKREPLIEEEQGDPSQAVISLRDCYFLQGFSVAELQREYGKQKLQAFQKRLKAMNADERQAWGNLCGNTEYVRARFGKPAKVQTQIAIAQATFTALAREAEFDKQFRGLLDGQALQSSLEFLVAQTTVKAPTLDAMRDTYRKAEQ